MTIFFPAHIEHPAPLFLFFTLASHSWSSPLSHFHQTFFEVPGTTSKGVKLPFKTECHSFDKSGLSVARQLEFTTLNPLHTVQFWPFDALEATDISHS